MRNLFWFGVIGLISMIVPLQADAWSPPPFKVDAGAKVWFNVHTYGWQAHLAPWYTYWPMEAHFQRSAPVGGHWPQWPGQWPPAQPPKNPAPPKNVDPNKSGNPNSGATAPYPQPLQLAPAYRSMPSYPNHANGYRPASYHYSSPPNYWYGR